MTHQWKVGDRFSVEGVITETADSAGNYQAVFDGHTTDGCVIAAEMAHAKLIKPAAPEPRIPEIKVGQQWVTRGGETVTILSDDGTCTYPFRYKTRWGGTRLVTRDGWHSGPERPDDDDLMRIVEFLEPQKLDTSKPIRNRRSLLKVKYVGTLTDGRIVVERDLDGKIQCDIFPESELENIPEPKIKGRREALLGPDGELYWVSSWPGNHPLEILGRVWVEITEGDGMEAEA